MRMQGAAEDDRYKELEGVLGVLGLEHTRPVINPSTDTWRVRPEVAARLKQLAALTTDLLPDFLDGLIRTELEVPTDWAGSPHICVQYVERGGDRGHPINDYGRGASRWLSIALQVAIQALLQRLAAVRGRLSLCADQAAAAKWWLSMPMASVSAEGPMPKALSTRRTSPLMPGCRHQGRACPLRRARMTSNPLIVA